LNIKQQHLFGVKKIKYLTVSLLVWVGGPELILRSVCLATKGSIKRLSKSVRQLQVFPIGSHSKKPNEFKKLILELVGDLPRIELFARQKTEGWDAWGNEV
jgi:N6-adenosine-specific RNA methylase IME4